MAIVTEIISAVGAWITGIFGWVGDAITGVTTIFYDPSVDGGLTIVGVLLLFGLGMTLVFFAINFIKGLIRK